MLEGLINFSQAMDAGIFASLNQMVGVVWGAGWYAIILLPLIFLFGGKFIMYAMGKYKGDKLEGEFYKFLSSTMLLIGGFMGIPMVEGVAKYFNIEVQNRVANAPKVLYEMNKQGASAEAKQFVVMLENARTLDGGDEEVNKFINGLSSHSKMLFDQIVLDAAKNQSMTLSEHEVAQIQEMITNSGAADAGVNAALAEGFGNVEKMVRAADALSQYQDLDPKQLSADLADVSLFSPIGDLVAWLFLVVGTIIKIIILFIRGALMFIFWMAFPITVAMSFIPTMEGAVKEWWDNYKPLALMLISITLIEALTNLVWIITRGGVSVPYAGITNGLCAFVSGILFFMTPTITTMLFGGGSAMSGMGQQIMSGGGMMLLGASYAKGVLFGGKDKQGGTKPGLLGTLGNFGKLGREMYNTLQGGGGGSNMPPPNTGGGGAPVV